MQTAVKTVFRKFLLPLLAALVVLALVAAGVLHTPDRWTQDSLFQQRGTPSGEIIIIGINDETLAELGPYGPSYRTVVAYALETLASDPEHLPAVVAIDVLYEGESGTGGDAKLAAAAEKLGNVVTACMAEYGTEITWENSHAVELNTSAVKNFVEPFPALRDVTVQGHINAMSDMDGILRHALLYVTKPGGEMVYSMAAQAARLYCEKKGQALRLSPDKTARHYYVSFTGKPGDYDDGFSVYRLITGQIPPEAWAGKIVLIGPYAAALQDAYFTAASKADPMFGVEYQANVIQSLLKGNLRTEVGDVLQFAVLAALSLAASYLFFLRKASFGAILCAALMLLGFAGAYLFYLAGYVTHVLWLPFCALLLYLAALVAHYIQAARERRALALEKERIATELSLASRIQANFLPKQVPDRHEVSIAASMTPAKEVGGDLYDYFFIDDDHLCLAIGDVSGKGVPASLFMMLASALIHHVAMHETSPAKILTEVNAEICNRNPEEMFVTVWLGVLELSTGILTAANAGHEYPAVRHPGEAFDLLKDRHGFVVGGMEGIRYRDYTVQLEPGSRMFFYTDGVPEATNISEELFGTQRMVDALRTKENESPEELLNAVNQAVAAFVGKAPQFDDLTMLCIQYNGPAGLSEHPDRS